MTNLTAKLQKNFDICKKSCIFATLNEEIRFSHMEFFVRKECWKAPFGKCNRTSDRVTHLSRFDANIHTGRFRTSESIFQYLYYPYSAINIRMV